jgi:cyanophycinase-like exopeptidase
VPGPLALVGSGEFLEAMRPVDESLLEGRPRRAVFLPTAAAEEGGERIRYWLDLGTAHYLAMGVEPVPLPVLDRTDAGLPELAGAVAGAGLVYLSGGNPGYLADTLRGTLVFEAILDAWNNGTALAGCSAGALALTAVADDPRRPGRFSGLGLGVVPGLAVVPHYDVFAKRFPQLPARIISRAPEGVTVVGVDEDTALVGGPELFEVRGRLSAWQLHRDGTSTEFPPGSKFEVPPVRLAEGTPP